MKNREFYKNRRVLVTGHTGFKGTWLCKILLGMGAIVCGYAKEPTQEQIFFKMSGIEEKIVNIYGDIRDLQHLQQVMWEFQPEVVFHLAAQPIVRESYEFPVDTYSTNVMGTVNILEAVRLSTTVRSIINVTTDKVYENQETYKAYAELDRLNGYDPYSNSKSCSELITDSYRKCFLKQKKVAVSTCRAGNVIGGGDFSKDRIIPDCFKAVKNGRKIVLRNPDSVRPYQHVLEPLAAYLQVAQKQYENCLNEGAYNIGPNNEDNITTGELVDLFCKVWGCGATWECHEEVKSVHEAKLLYLDCTKMKQVMGWQPVWNIEKTIEKTVEWYREYVIGNDIVACMERQIREFYQEVCWL